MYVYHVSIDRVQTGMMLVEPVFVTNSNGKKLMIASENSTITDRVLDLLHRYDVKTVAVLLNIKPKVMPKRDDTEELARVKPLIAPNLREKVVQHIEKIFGILTSDPSQEANMTTAYKSLENFDKIVGVMTSQMLMDNRAAVHIFDVKSYDEYTFHHSLSVGVLAVSIGQQLGLDPARIANLGRCAILHDIGKLLIPKRILNKAGKLTNEEFEIMKKHSEFGAQTLKEHSYGNVELWNGVMLHHEKINGKGYPRNLRNNNIPLFSRIISIADIYDAVTSYRPYRAPMTPSDAYELIMSEASQSLDFELVEAFFKRLTLYPLNLTVALSDNRVGLVVENNNSLRPVVRLKDTDELLDLASPKNLNLTITKVYDVKR